MKNVLKVFIFSIVFFSCKEKGNPVDNNTPVKEILVTDHFSDYRDSVTGNYIVGLNYDVSTSRYDLSNFDSVTASWTCSIDSLSGSMVSYLINDQTIAKTSQTKKIYSYSISCNNFEIVNKSSVTFIFRIVTNSPTKITLSNLKIIGWQ